MTTALVVNEGQGCSQHLIETLHQQYSAWNIINVDKYEDALEKIQNESINVLTLDAQLSCKDCLALTDELHDKQPNAEIYISRN